MFSCFGPGHRRRSDEHQPLLPQYDDETSLQRRVHQKLHSYQIVRALSKGFMPSSEQLVANLRTLLSSAILNPDAGSVSLSDSGQALVHCFKLCIKHLIDLLVHKNADDQIQEFIWYLTKAKLSADVEHLAERAMRAKTGADRAAVYSSLQTVASLLLTNSNFRLFLKDLNVIAREVFRDTAFAVSEASREAAERIKPSAEEQESLKQPYHDSHSNFSQHDVLEQTAELSRVFSGTASTVVGEAENSIVRKLSGPEKDTLVHRLKEAVLNLRQRPTYVDSVSTLSLLFKRYIVIYSRMARHTIEAASEDIDHNPEAEAALANFWGFLRSFGEPREWEELQNRARAIAEHGCEDPKFEELAIHIGNILQEMLTDPAFFDSIEQSFQELRDQSKQLTTHSSLREDVDALLLQVQSTLTSVVKDKDIANLAKTSAAIASILSPSGQYVNSDLVADALNVFIPLLVQSIHYIPIPRAEISTPKMDLLLENLILEPGVTINNTSFFPYKLRVKTLTDVEIHKTRFRTTSAIKTLVRLHIDGLSLRGEEIGFWLRVHSGLLRWADEGIASFALDERGMDVQLDVEVGRDRMDKILTLRGVRVRIHKLDWTLHRTRSSFGFISWLFKPFLKPIVRKMVEIRMASAIAQAFQFANRELLFARERLRATRIADPQDLKTFIKAVLARLTLPEDPDLHVRVGLTGSGQGVFEGVYTPGSIVKLWREEATQVSQRIREQQRDGWRNSIFDVQGAVPAY